MAENAYIVGSAHRLSEASMQVWLNSGYRNFSGRGQILLSYDMKPEVINELRHTRGIIVYEHELTHHQVVISRFKDYVSLAESLDEDVWLICTDVTDLAFQVDPMGFVKKVTTDNPEISIIAASEGVPFSKNKWTNQNLKSAFPEHYEFMKDRHFYNAGSFAAKAGVLKDLAAKVYKMCLDAPESARNHDQAALNILLYGEFQKKTWFEPADGKWCYCAASSLYNEDPEDKAGYEATLPEVENGICRFGGTVPAMFHHWTRNPGAMRAVTRAYPKAGPDPMMRSSIPGGG